MSYDKVVKKTVEGEAVHYGLIVGNEKIVFIKTGAGGSIKGYKDKYLNMAHRIHDRMGATVLCASNPDVDHRAVDKAMISQMASEINGSGCEVYFVGVSDGAYHNLVLAKEIPETVKVLGINTSRKTAEDFKEKVCALAHVKTILVYGTKDYESDIVPTLQEFAGDNLEIIPVEGADHQFHGMPEEFIALTDLL